MSFFRYIFAFLYVRNWHNGHMELSRPRVAIFFAIIFLVLLALTMIAFLQAPVEYVAS